MKKYVNTRVLLLFCLCALLLAGAAVTYAWYRPIKLNFAPAKVDGSIRASYFESGNGSQAEPFEIAKPEQFYNLAWLQYLGRFNEAGENEVIPTTYFRLSADIDMTGYVLPPVGTEKYPFVGNFDGEGKTVTGLKIAVPTDLPIEGEYEKPQIVGAFGVVGTMNGDAGNITIDGRNYTYSSAANEVKNVTFKGLTVETQTTSALIGLAAGYVNGTLTNVGIQLDNTLKSKLDIKFNTSPLNAISANLSDHSLVGYTKDVETDTSNTVKHYQPTAARGTFTAKGETGDDETTGGGSLNVANLHGRLAEFRTDAVETASNNMSTYSSAKYYTFNGGNKGSVTFDDYNEQHGYYDLFGKPRWWATSLVYNATPAEGTYYIAAPNSSVTYSYSNNHLTVKSGMVENGINRRVSFPWTLHQNGAGWSLSVGINIGQGNEKTYYLVEESGTLSVTTDSDSSYVWSISGKSIFTTVDGVTKYLGYDAESKKWTLGNADGKLGFAVCTAPTDNLLSLIDTYLPLKVNEDNTVSDTNSGYLVGGTNYISTTDSGDVQVIKRSIKASDNFFSNGAIVDESVNYFENGDIGSPKTSPTGDAYTAAKGHFVEAIGLNSTESAKEIYAIRFMGSNVENFIVANDVKMNSTTTRHNYQMPEGCIDFTLTQSSKIAFFATHSGKNTYSFFALYHIVRSTTDDSLIESIKEIKEIYDSGIRGKYTYLYSDGTTNDGSSIEGKVRIYETSALTEQRSASVAGTDLSPKLYYFEIPLHSGEYALSGVANGAALMYLDIGVGDSAGVTEGLIPAGAEVTRTKTTEVIVTEHRETSAPKGVDFVTTPVTVTPPSVTKATATKRLDGTASGVYEFSTTNGGAACTHGGATETLGLDGTVTTAKRCIVTLTDTWQKDNVPVTRTIRVVYDGTNTTYAVTMNGETNTYTYNDLKDKADITGVGNGVENTAPKLPSPEEMAALNAEGETVLEYTYTAADAVIDSVFDPTLTAGTDGTVAVTGGSYTVTSNATLTEKKRNSSYTVTYNTNTAAP